MIGRLSGSVVHEESDGTVILDVGGVGYEVMTPAGAVARARLASGNQDPVTLWIHTHVREDVIMLFGFCDMTERAVFRTLLGISSVGPRTAVSILSSVSALELAQAVHARDSAALVKIPGIGKKTAERLILELRDKLSPAQATSAPGTVAAPNPIGPQANLVIDALTRMGFKPQEAERAVSALGELGNIGSVDKAIREALTILRR